MYADIKKRKHKSVPYNGNDSRKKTFANDVQFPHSQENFTIYCFIA